MSIVFVKIEEFLGELFAELIAVAKLVATLRELVDKLLQQFLFDRRHVPLLKKYYYYNGTPLLIKKEFYDDLELERNVIEGLVDADNKDHVRILYKAPLHKQLFTYLSDKGVEQNLFLKFYKFICGQCTMLVTEPLNLPNVCYNDRLWDRLVDIKESLRLTPRFQEIYRIRQVDIDDLFGVLMEPQSPTQSLSNRQQSVFRFRPYMPRESTSVASPEPQSPRKQSRGVFRFRPYTAARPQNNDIDSNSP